MTESILIKVMIMQIQKLAEKYDGRNLSNIEFEFASSNAAKGFFKAVDRILPSVYRKVGTHVILKENENGSQE